MSNKKKLLLAMTSVLTLSLSGCFLEGDDGSQGPAGPAGPAGAVGAPGADGADGQDAPNSLSATLIGRAVLNPSDPEGAAEIVAYQASKGWVYAVNSSADPVVVEILDINSLSPEALTPDAEGVVDNTNVTSAITLDVNTSSGLTGDANSIAFDNNNEVLAVAVAAENTGDRGSVAFYDVSGAQPVFIKNVEVGFLPDSVAFTHDGTKAVVANEGEPAGDYSVDPEGSISIIELTDGVPADDDIELTLEGLDRAALEAQGAVFANPDGRTINGNLYTASVEKDLEPEFVGISEDDTLAFVSIQENNALAIVDLTTNTLSNVIGLGFKDWGSLTLDASDRDSGVNFRSYPGLYGIYMADTVDSYTWNGANFIVTANEGDGREYFFDAADEATCTANGGLDFDEDDGCLAFIDEIRVEDLTLGANFDYVNNDDNDIGRLLVTTFLGADDDSTDGSGTYSELYTYGARSFTIWDTNGLVVFDSGDDMERVTAAIYGPAFNNNNDENEGDTRSDAKGPEPEALTIGKIDGRNYAFVGLERMGGVMAYDITNPYNVEFVGFFNNRGVVEGADITGDLAPEGMSFIEAADSPTGEALLVIGNEISGSVSIWEITVP
ncbi:choice-of-anchor I family protein [Glaciecola sp. XM2]|uniref:choice-of-anchor I family protein n=1 Tax=Glaciecola sp. XM2 TaxID=1914931 RepID=UPI001BDE50D9|nr:choice-of-anchor I family protein [Glaciecola sp. XM2]MBT1452372.1 choice-of-anchor I family protein [Glaciecola sp. XM2]